MQGAAEMETLVISINADKLAAEARKALRSLKIYKKEFEPVLTIYGQLRDQYEVLTQQFIASGYELCAGGRKSPVVTTLESLRKDILAYASQLGFTPQGLLKVNASAFTERKTDALAKLLREADKK